MLGESYVLLFIYTVRSTYCQHVCDIEKTFPIYFVLSLFKQNWAQFPLHNNLYFLQHIDILPTVGTWIFPPECDVSRGF